MRLCIANSLCTDPLLSVSLMDRADKKQQVIDADLCARHAVGVSHDGFTILAWTHWSDITHLIPRAVLRDFPIGWLSETQWTEMFAVDRLICPYGCKVHGRLVRSETHVSGWSIDCRVIHSRTYGCKVGG